MVNFHENNVIEQKHLNSPKMGSIFSMQSIVFWIYIIVGWNMKYNSPRLLVCHLLSVFLWLVPLSDSGPDGREEDVGPGLLAAWPGLAGRHPAWKGQEEEGGWEEKEREEKSQSGRTQQQRWRGKTKQMCEMLSCWYTHKHREDLMLFVCVVI